MPAPATNGAKVAEAGSLGVIACAAAVAALGLMLAPGSASAKGHGHAHGHHAHAHGKHAHVHHSKHGHRHMHAHNHHHKWHHFARHYGRRWHYKNYETTYASERNYGYSKHRYSYSKPSRTCLIKEYAPDGAVVFKDICTKETAVAMPDDGKAASRN